MKRTDPPVRWKACIFDFDGVIIDSEPLHAEAKRVTLNHFLIPHSDGLFAEFKGRPDSAFFQHVAAELAAGRKGIRAAKAARCEVIGLATNFPAEELLDAGADRVMATFGELSQAMGIPISGIRHGSS